MSERNYFLPGEYIGDMHYGMSHIASKLRGRLGEDAHLDLKQIQLELHSKEQRESFEMFLDATRDLAEESVGYLNKMLVAVDERTGAYLYDGRYFGIVTF